MLNMKNIMVKKIIIVFKKPVKQVDVIEFSCEKIKQGHTSVTFEIFAVVKNEEVFRTECTFVAVDNNGRTTLIEWPEENQNQ